MTSSVLSRVRALVPLLAAAPLLAQAPPAPTPAPTPRPGVVAAEEITILTLDVVAVDGKQRPVFGLTAADFEIRVAGKLQPIDFFEPPQARPAAAPKEGRPDSEDRIAGTTTPFEQKGPVRHVLFYVDLEQLPRRAIADAAASIRTALEHPGAGRYGLATYFTRPDGRVWDSNSRDAILFEADAIAAEATAPSTAVVDSGVSAWGRESGTSRASAPSGSPPSYEMRKAREKQLIDDLIFAETSSTNPPVDQIAAISRYLTDERRRVTDAIAGFRDTCVRFQGLEGPRHVVVLSEGFERVPGFNFLARLKSEEMARVRVASAPSGITGSDPLRNLPGMAIPGAPGSAQALGSSRFVWNPTPLLEIDDLSRWLAASGIIVHYVDPGSLGRGLPSAADKYAWEGARRSEDAKNLQETPMRFASDTGGLVRVATNDAANAVADLVDASAATYRIGVRLTGVDPRKSYSVKVATRKAGVNMYARSAFKPAGPAPVAAAALSEEARRAGSATRTDAARPGAARTAKKAIPVALEWRGRASTPSPDPAKPFWKLEVRIPHEELKFETESDAFVASVKISVEAAATDGPLRDATADDWFLSYSGDEYKEVRDAPAVRVVTLQLPPGSWALTVSVHDALGGTYGQAALRVEAR